MSMDAPSKSKTQATPDDQVWDFAGTRRHHIRSGLRLTPAERLKWLEETVDEMRRLQGRARLGRVIGKT
jgi:hypothetical protein